MLAAAAYLCTVAWVADGDTLTCVDQTRIRLAGIEAPEMTCRPPGQQRRPCITAGAIESRRALIAIAPAGTALTCRGRRRSYDRIVSWCVTDRGIDLSCAMVASGRAARVDRHWGRHACPSPAVGRSTPIAR